MRSVSESLPGGKARPTPHADRSWVLAPGIGAQAVKNFPKTTESAPSVRVTSSQVAAFAALVRPFERAIYLVALAFVNHPEGAMEVAQESVFRAFRSNAKVSHAEQLKSWLITIVIDEARFFLREREQVDCDDVTMDDEPENLGIAPCPVTQWGPIPDSATSLQKTRDTLNAALGRLARKFRVVLFLRDVLGFTTTETSTVLGVSEDTVRTRLARARLAMCCDLTQVTVPTA
jgi:RNA polymerase sigma-70 factor (ECF subfamily)